MHGGDLREAGFDPDLAAIVERDYREAPLEPALRALLDYVVTLTLRPADCTEAHVDHLRGHGWTDPQIHNAVLTASYFNFINRVAEGLGVDPEPELAGCAPLAPWRDQV